MLLAALLAHAGHHGALDAADDVGAVVELLDHPDDVLDLRLGGMRFHHNNHSGANPPETTEPRTAHANVWTGETVNGEKPAKLK